MIPCASAKRRAERQSKLQKQSKQTQEKYVRGLKRAIPTNFAQETQKSSFNFFCHKDHKKRREKLALNNTKTNWIS
jgi:hypothetical protein